MIKNILFVTVFIFVLAYPAFADEASAPAKKDGLDKAIDAGNEGLKDLGKFGRKILGNDKDPKKSKESSKKADKKTKLDKWIDGESSDKDSKKN